MSDGKSAPSGALLSEVIDAARRAGDAIMSYYDGEVEVYEKEDETPLTRADLASQEVILEGLRDADPDTPVIAEESGVPDYEERREWERFWLVDPLDGTKEFLKKNGEFTVNIALVEEGKPVLGAVYIPAKEILYFAERGEGAWKTEKGGRAWPISSRPADRSRPLKIVESRSHRSPEQDEMLEEEGITAGESVSAGSSLKFCLVAEGAADIYPRVGPTMEWDVAAGDCVWRCSAEEGEHDSPLRYNKPDLKNGPFIIGL